MIDSAYSWSNLPYPNEIYGPLGETPNAGTWPLRYFKLGSNGEFYDLDNNIVNFTIDGNKYDMNFWEMQVELIREKQKTLTPEEKALATYWSSKSLPNIQFPVVIDLVKKYNVPLNESSIIYSVSGDTINDALNICFYYKYKYDIPRPVQLDPTLQTYLKTTYDPSFPVGHGVTGGALQVVLSYFFPESREEIINTFNNATYSRFYGGIHYEIDCIEGLKLGRQIGEIILEEI